MKAIVYQKYGTPDVLELKEVEKPVPKNGEVLIKVRAASINSWDWDLLKGALQSRLPGAKPKRKILGCDIAGKVEAAGGNAKRFKPGEEVFGDLSGGSWGGFAEYVCADENLLTLKPEKMSFEEAAATPQAGLLALQGLLYNGGIKLGQKVLINGAGGGVGTFAIQIAKTYGADVTGVDMESKFAVMRSLGADRVIDFSKEEFTKNGLSYDLIIDVAARRSPFDYKRSLNPNGAYAAIGGSTKAILEIIFLSPFISMTGNRKVGLLLHKANKHIDLLKELFAAGKVKPVIDKTFPLEQTGEAFRYYGEGKFQGKIVIVI